MVANPLSREDLFLGTSCSNLSFDSEAPSVASGRTSRRPVQRELRDSWVSALQTKALSSGLICASTGA